MNKDINVNPDERIRSSQVQDYVNLGQLKSMMDSDYDEKYYGIQVFSNATDAWRVMVGKYGEGVDYGESRLIILDDDSFPKYIRQKAYEIAGDYFFCKQLDEENYKSSMFLSDVISGRLLDFNFFLYSKKADKYYTSRMEFKDDGCHLWSKRQWGIFDELSSLYDFESICLDAHYTVARIASKSDSEFEYEVLMDETISF